MSQPYRVDRETDALIIVDVQRDFCAGGALAVPNGDDVVPVLNEWLAIEGLLAIATRDWHPPDHCSFKEQGGPWPEHCVQNTPGAELHPDLNAAAVDVVADGATDPEREAYSGFDAPILLETLRTRGIRRLWVGGLATEYCVKATALDGRRYGFDVSLIEDAIRGIDVEPGDCDKAKREMEEAGIIIVRSADVAKE